MKKSPFGIFNIHNSKLSLVPWCSGLTCLPVTQETAGSNPVGTDSSKNHKAQIASFALFYKGFSAFSVVSGCPFLNYFKG